MANVVLLSGPWHYKNSELATAKSVDEAKADHIDARQQRLAVKFSELEQLTHESCTRSFHECIAETETNNHTAGVTGTDSTTRVSFIQTHLELLRWLRREQVQEDPMLLPTPR